MKFNPKAETPQSKNEPLPSGVYLLGLTWFRRKISQRSGLEYLSVKYRVIGGGKMAGREFFTMLSLDLSKPGAVKRWQILCEVLGVQEPFELGSSEEGTTEEGDENIRRLFLGRGVKATVALEERNGYVNNNISELAFPRQYTEDDARLIREWERAWRERGDNFDAPDDLAPQGSDDGYFDDRADPDDEDSLDF